MRVGYETEHWSAILFCNNVFDSVYLQPALTLSPNPGEKTARAPAIAFTVQSTVLF